MKAVAGLVAVLLMVSSASLAQTTAPTHPTAPAQQTAPAGEPSAPEAASPPSAASPSPTGAASSAEAAAATAGAAPAAAFAPGAKVFVEPMDGFGQLVSDAIVKKKVPVVVVKERANADFVMSGEAHVKKRGFVTGVVLSTRGGGTVSIKDARTGNQVFAYSFHRVDAMEREGDIYLNWADQSAEHLKKAMKKK